MRCFTPKKVTLQSKITKNKHFRYGENDKDTVSK